jgi:hypothetical protein
MAGGALCEGGPGATSFRAPLPRSAGIHGCPATAGKHGRQMLEFTILCACRSGERSAQYGARSIGKRERGSYGRVSLGEPAIRLHGHCLARASSRRGGPRSDATLRALLERMNVAVTVHLTLKPEMIDEEIINGDGDDEQLN